MANRRHKRARVPLKGLLLAFFASGLFLLTCAVALIIGGLCDAWNTNLPSLENTKAFDFATKSVMYAADENTKLAEFQLEKRETVTLDKVAPLAIQATLDTEDRRFYDHNGIDYLGILRAITMQLTGKRREGASTITQQLVRNTLLTHEAQEISLKRKAREAALALQLEKKYSKQEILELYFNTVNYGDGIYGIQKAAELYFQKQASELSLPQAALLAGIPQSPTRLNPKVHPKAALKRRNTVLARMKSAGHITQDEYDAAVAMPLELHPAEASPFQGIYAHPYFTSYVRDLILNHGEKYHVSRASLFEGGLKIYTTLDPVLQQKAEDAYEQYFAGANANRNGALVAIEPTNAQVKALIGGRNFEEQQWNAAVQGGRPTGSTFKMFTLVTAIKQGINPNTRIDCSDPAINTQGGLIHNFSYKGYGMRSIAFATAISSNTGFYRLAQQVGAEALIETAHDMGIHAKLPAFPIITLGTENVTPLEMAGAYSTLAAGGWQRDPVVVTKIIDKNGMVIFEENGEAKRALEESVAGAATQVLRGVFETPGGTAYGARPSNGQVVAGKSGTSQNFRDNWFVGYSPTLVCSVWVGNTDFTPLPRHIGALPLWKRFMSLALAGQKPVDFPETEAPFYLEPDIAPDTGRDEDELQEEIPAGGTSLLPEADTAHPGGLDPRTAPHVVGKSLEDAMRELGSYWVVKQFVPAEQPANTVFKQAWHGNVVLLYIAKDVAQNALDGGAAGGAGAAGAGAGTASAGTDAGGGAGDDADNAGAGGTSGAGSANGGTDAGGAGTGGAPQNTGGAGAAVAAGAEIAAGISAAASIGAGISGAR